MMKKARFFHDVFLVACTLAWLISLAGTPLRATAATGDAANMVLLAQDFNGTTGDLLNAGWSVKMKKTDALCPNEGVWDANEATSGGIDCGYHTPALANDRAFGYYQTSYQNPATIHLSFHNTLGLITQISGSFDLESTWSQYDATTRRFAQLRGREQGNEVALSYVIGNGNSRGILLTPDQIEPFANRKITPLLAQTWLNDEQMNALALSQRGIAFDLGAVQLDVCDTLELTWHGDDNPVNAQEMQLNLDNFVMNGTVASLPPGVVQVNAAWVGNQACDVINLNGTRYYYGYNAFADLQSAIDAVASGGTLVVAAGTYHQAVTIAKPLTLSGSASVIPMLSLAAPINFSGVGADAVIVQPGGSIQNASDLLTPNGTLEVRSGLYDGPLTIGTPQTIRASGPVTLTAGSGPAITSTAAGNVTLKGFSIQTRGTVFQQSAGTLDVYANNILPGFARAYHGTGGTFRAAHNWWGSNDPNAPQPAGLSAADWQARLGATVKHWQDGPDSVVLADSRNAGQASLSGGTGVAVIVSHGRADNSAQAPFGDGVNARARTMCSDFYDFFVLPGSSGNWQIELPVDNTTACNAYVRDLDLAYFVPLTTTYGVSCSPASASSCWLRLDPVNVSHFGQALRLSNLSPATLGGTPFVAGSGSNAPTAVRLSMLRASSEGEFRGFSPFAWFGLILLGLALSLVWCNLWRIKKAAPER